MTPPAPPTPRKPGPSPAPHLAALDFSVLQQCIHCGLCLPTCPTYDETKLERNSPRGRIALMRAVAEERLPVTPAFGDELYFCLGCLACETVCPADVHYGKMFESARADIEASGVRASPRRNLVRTLTLRRLFTRPRLLRLVGRLLYLHQASGFESLVRRTGLTRLLPRSLRELEPLAPRIHRHFSDAQIAAHERPATTPATRRVALLTGCVQDLTCPDVNRDTADVLLANGCEVITPRAQHCCGSLHAHNGELDRSRQLLRRNIDALEAAAGPLDRLDAIITNAAGCGSHLKNYGHLLHDDPTYADRAATWSRKLKDIHEYLVEIDFRAPRQPAKNPTPAEPITVTYHEACHLCHGQKITRQPRAILRAIPGLRLTELPESTWCCGSAGIYNITQPEMSRKLLDRKMTNVHRTKAKVIASANPGCAVQLQFGIDQSQSDLTIAHPITLLAQAYRNEDLTA